MDKFERAEYAVALKHGGYNCSQAVAVVFKDLVDVPENVLKNATSGFGIGMGCMEATCGSLTGAGIIAGLLLDGRGAIRASAALHKAFVDKCGASICKDLKGRDTGKVICSCDDCVRNAVLALSETLNI